MILLTRTILSLGVVGLAYYIGKQIGQTESSRKEVQTWRKENADKNPSPSQEK